MLSAAEATPNCRSPAGLQRLPSGFGTERGFNVSGTSPEGVPGRHVQAAGRQFGLRGASGPSESWGRPLGRSAHRRPAVCIARFHGHRAGRQIAGRHAADDDAGGWFIGVEGLLQLLILILEPGDLLLFLPIVGRLKSSTMGRCGILPRPRSRDPERCIARFS